MVNLKWKIGEVEIFQIVELEAGQIIQSVIKDATPQNIKDISWLYPNFADKKGKLKALVQGFLIKSNGKNILIDTCNGNDKKRVDLPEWGSLKTDFLKKFNELGVTEKNIDVVACTHLHMDHIGWNTKLENDRWVPTFPKAKYLFAKEEYEYWRKKPEEEIADDNAGFDDSISPIINSGLAELVDINHKIDQNVSFIPSPGHTPAHVCVLIESGDQRAIISGDMLHHPCQIAKPEWTTEADTSPEKAFLTRQKLLDEIVGTNTLLIGSHFANPTAGLVVRIDDGFILKSENIKN